MRNGPRRGSGERSNLYSHCKFTNWKRFDPFSSEVKGVLGRPKLVPALRIDEIELPIYSIRLHSRFLRPCAAKDVAEVLSEMPRRFLQGLRGVFLLGGSAKQAVVARGSLFRFGCYFPGAILLHAFPRDLLSFETGTPLKPSLAREYQRAGAQVVQSGADTFVEFDEASLRRFYLCDVLLHEVGHHVDKHVFSRPDRDAERFADWFVQERIRRGRERRLA